MTVPDLPLTGLLDGSLPRGAYRWEPQAGEGGSGDEQGFRDGSASGIDRLGHAVAAAGRPFARVEPGGTSAADLHDALAGALDLPPWYGANLDALHDVLRDVRPDTVLVWPDWGATAEQEPRTVEVAVSLLGGALTLLLRGPGPDLGLPRIR